jgi:hypothetical protein
LNANYLIKRIGTAPPPLQKIVEDQDAFDIIKQIKIKHKSCAADYDKIAADFEGGTVYDIAERLFNFCKANLKYHRETINKQYVSSPQTMLMRGYCDCKGYALFIGGVLDALNRKGFDIKWAYRFASDDIFNEIPGHVFIVVNDKGREIWIDPVLSEFNQDYFFPYHVDKKVSVNGVGCCGAGIGGMAILRGVGATTKETGQIIMKVAPALAAIPVIGWVAAPVAEIAGFFLTAFGSNFHTSTNVRWLTAKFQYYVLGQTYAVSDNHVNEQYTDQAQAWFTTVMGVPIFDQLRYHALRGTSPKDGSNLNLSRTQRAQNYLNSAPDAVAARVTLDQAIQATYNADKFIENKIAGSWAGFTAAPQLIDKGTGSEPTTFVNQAGQVVDVNGNPVSGTGISGNKNILILAAAAVAAVLFIK